MGTTKWVPLNAAGAMKKPLAYRRSGCSQISAADVQFETYRVERNGDAIVCPSRDTELKCGPDSNDVLAGEEGAHPATVKSHTDRRDNSSNSVSEVCCSPTHQPNSNDRPPGHSIGGNQLV